MKDDMGKRIRKVFEDLQIDLVNAPEDLICDVIKDTVGQMQFEKCKNELIKILHHRNVSANVNYEKCFIQSLSKDKTSWKKLEKDVVVKGKGGKVIKATLTSTPASEFGYFANLENGTGVGSNERDTDKAMNMWKTEVKSKEGKVLFSGIRHGNTRGKESSSKEIILAAAVQQYGIEALLESDENKVWEVKLGNVQLMTPIKVIGDGDMPFQQMETFREMADNGPFRINIKDKDGKIKKITLKLVKPILVNFGTNAQHYALGGVVAKSSYKKNREAFVDLFGKAIMDELDEKSYDSIVNVNEKLKGEVGNYLENLDNEFNVLNAKILENLSPKTKVILKHNLSEISMKKKKIVNLSNQILYIWANTNGAGKKTNPAAIQTRLAALMYLIGYPVSFNCKSGKDRTGEVSAEINDLMLTMEANNGDVPDPYAELSDDEKLQASNIFDATQSDSITQANTGHRGLKVRFKGTTSRFGKILGASKHAKI